MTEKYSVADFLLHAGIPTYIDPVHAIAHNKVMVIDGQVVITRAFNFTRAAETMNAENLLIIDNPGLAAKYLQNRLHEGHSYQYQAGDRSRVQSRGGRAAEESVAGRYMEYHLLRCVLEKFIR